MNPKEYKDMMSHLVRPDTRPPEVQKAAEEKRFNADLDRKNKKKKRCRPSRVFRWFIRLIHTTTKH